MDRTRIELFYRQPITADLIEADDRGRTRGRIRQYQNLQTHIENESQNRSSNVAELEKLRSAGLDARFLIDQGKATELIYRLLRITPIFDRDGRFLCDVVYGSRDLDRFMKFAKAQKAVIENQLGFEVRSDAEAGVAQLRSVLKIIGLEQEKAGKTKAKAVAGGQTVYLYRLSKSQLDAIQAIVKRRRTIGGWTFLAETYGQEFDGD